MEKYMKKIRKITEKCIDELKKIEYDTDIRNITKLFKEIRRNKQ